MTLPSAKTFDYWSDAGELLPAVSTLNSASFDYWGDAGELVPAISGAASGSGSTLLELGRLNDTVLFTHGYVSGGR